MDFIKNHKATIIGVLAIVILFVLYGVFFRDDSADEDLLVSNNDFTVSATANNVSNETVAAIAGLRSQSLDIGLFSSAEFQNLKDFTQELEDELSGRENPFAPVGDDTVVNPFSGGSSVVDDSGSDDTFPPS